jgi:hypothetical protein
MCTPPLAARLRKTPVVGLKPVFVGFSLRHIPAHRKPTVCHIRWAGTSHTTGTLCEIGAKIIKNNELQGWFLTFFRALTKAYIHTKMMIYGF